jgi:predicted Zn finger-like uncharacterized protein
MIVTCTSCLTKFTLDDSKVPAKGAKVRCSRCQHVFYIVSPPETKEEVMEDFESFAKYHKELMGPEQKAGSTDLTPSPLPRTKEREKPAGPPEKPAEESFAEEEEMDLFSDGRKGVKEGEPAPSVREERAEVKAAKPRKTVRGEWRRPSLVFVLLIICLLLGFGLFYVWIEVGSTGRLPSFLETPIKRITQLWGQVFGTERQGLTVSDLSGYEEKVGETPIFVIEGKVTNRSDFAKKHIKVNVVIFDQNRKKVAEKEAICGRVIARGDLKISPPDFLKGEMMIKPQKPKEMVCASGKSIPFMVIFRDLSTQAKEFKVEILESPNL